MAFPFVSHTGALRQRILVAIGAGGLAALGCSNTQQMGTAGSGTATGESGQGASAASGASGGSIAAGSGVSGTAGAPSGMGGGGATAGAGGFVATAGSGGGGNAVVDAGPIRIDAGILARDAGLMMPPPDASTVANVCPLGQPADSECYSRIEMESKARFGCGQIPTSPEPTDEEVAAAFLSDGCLPMNMACDGCCNPAAAPGVPMGDGSCCYVHCVGACCGRPLTVDGSDRLAGVAPRADWLAVAPSEPGAALPGWLRDRITDAWLADARMEHASIASFARFSLELLAFGAPADLLEDTQRAALDEVAHARECFALARRYGDRALGPAALDVAGVRAAATLRESLCAAFVEGCVGETQAAALASHAASLATDPHVRRVLTKIADDEARHAELAWRYAAWALDQDASLASELSAALARATAQAAVHEETERAEVRDALHAAGRLTAAEQADVMAHTLAEVVVPCADALLGTRRAAA